MTALRQLVIYSAGILITVVEAQPQGFLKLLIDIGTSHGGPHATLDRSRETHWQFSPVAVDRVLTVCFAAVTAYIGYIIISFFIQPKLKQTTVDLSQNPGLKALLASHHFRDNGMPAKMRNLFEATDILPDHSYIGNREKCIPVHAAPMKSASNVMQL